MKGILKIIGLVLCVAIIIGIIIIICVYSEPKIAVLNYHNVLSQEEFDGLNDKEKIWSIVVNNFEEEMKYLHDHNYKTLTMEEFCKWKEGEIDVPFKSVLITFDDGFLSNYHYALPILKKYDINASIFVIGKWSEKVSEQEENEWVGVYNSYMSKEQLEEIKSDYPNIELYSHTYNMHRKIEKSPAVYSYTREQMDEDAELYENYMGKTDIIAYPFGATNDEWVESLKNAGYKYGFLLGENKKATRNDDNFYINRVNVSTNKDMLHFAARLLLPY